jgi:S-adenosylmethionine:tRNA ribosyltransferase-isomerase
MDRRRGRRRHRRRRTARSLYEGRDPTDPAATDARLLAIDADGELIELPRARLAELFAPGDLLIANDAATLPASLTGVHAPSGAAIEVRLAGRPSLDAADVGRFTAIVFGGGDYRTPTEHRADPPSMKAGDTLNLAR